MRIDRPIEMPVRKYDNYFVANRRGSKLVVSQDDFGKADEYALAEMLKHDLYIKIDKPIYIDQKSEIFPVIKSMKKISKGNKISGNDMRLILIFTS